MSRPLKEISTQELLNQLTSIKPLHDSFKESYLTDILYKAMSQIVTEISHRDQALATELALKYLD